MNHKSVRLAVAKGIQTNANLLAVGARAARDAAAAIAPMLAQLGECEALGLCAAGSFEAMRGMEAAAREGARLMLQASARALRQAEGLPSGSGSDGGEG